MHQVVPAINYLFWAKCHPSKVFSQKKLWLKTQNRLFPPTTKPHPLNPLIVSPPLLYWLGTDWWCFGHCVLAPLSSFLCFLSFSHYFCHSKLALFRFAVCLFYSCLSFTKEGTSFWVCLISFHAFLTCMFTWHKFLPNQFVVPFLFFFLIFLGLLNPLAYTLFPFSTFVMPMGLLAATSYHVGPLGFYFFFLGSHGPLTLPLPLLCP